MAMASRRTREGRPPITLKLSFDEAVTLRTVLRMVGGPSVGRRGDVSRITDSLASVGVPYLRKCMTCFTSYGEGEIRLPENYDSRDAEEAFDG